MIITNEMQIKIDALVEKGIALGWAKEQDGNGGWVIQISRIKVQARRVVVLLARGEKLDRTDIAMFGLNSKPAADTSIDACPRCGGLGYGNWGSVVNGKCFRCGGTGKR